MNIRRDDPRRDPVAVLLRAHLAEMRAWSPPGSAHALDVDELCAPAVTFWTVTEGAALLGCGALLELDPRHGEVKSMRTAPAHLRRGVGTRMLRHIVDEARRRAYIRLSLETGVQAGFDPARALYRRFGFTECDPFGPYGTDPDSVYLTLLL